MSNDNEMIDGLAKLQMLAEATIGYRNKLLSGGMSQELADRLAEGFHTVLLKAAEQSIYNKK